MKITLLIIILFLILWSAYGYLGSRVEQMEYSVIKKGGDYEIRNYPTHIVAETAVSGPYGEAMNKGFTIVAGYIFGKNIKNEKIAMTSPVVSQENVSEKIAMTAPVLINNEGSIQTIAFGMPKSYTLDTLPTPTDSRVKIIEIPSKKFAVIRFAGYRTTTRIQTMEKKLLKLLSQDGLKTIGVPSYAGYNAPGTPPWMTRNEVLVEVQ